MYVVRNIARFMEQLENGETVEFGKNFTYDPYWHELSSRQGPLIGFLREVYEINRLSSDGYGGGSLHSSLFKDKYLCLTDALVKRFFSIMEDKGFTAVLRSQTYDNVRIRRESIPVAFAVESDGDDLALDIKMEETAVNITADGSYVLMGNRIYQPPKDQMRSIAPFLSILSRTGNGRLLFTREDKERFVSEILPYANQAGKVQVSDNVNAMIVKEQLLPEVYFDREGESIKARVQFKYGDRNIDPFDPHRLAAGKEGQILIRDVENERRVLELFEQYSFLVRPHGVYLEDEDKIFEFFHTGLPRLLEAATVFYSDDFKMIIRDRISYSAGIRLSAETDLLEFTFDIGDIDSSELNRVFTALREKKRYYRLKDGTFLPLDSNELNGLAQIMDHLGIREKELLQGHVEMPKYRALYLDRQLQESGIQDVAKNSEFNELVKDIRSPGDIPVEIPASLETTLRDYQRLGFKWLKTLSHYGLGGILADDMGLGKTLQILAMLLSDKQQGSQEPSMVVAPTSLIYNWEEEVQKFVPDLKTLIISGSKNERKKLMEQIPAADLVITSYPLIRRDKEDYEAYTFRCCIIDEAQHIKNPVSQGAKAVKSIQAKRRFAMTGTPMENSLSELWSIFDFIMPGYLFSHNKFMSTYEKPIVKDHDADSVEELARHIKPFILRRLKVDVLKELPEKIESKMVAELTEEQKKIYLAYLSQVRGEIAAEIDSSGYEKSHIKILSALTRLRQICCHPGVFLEDYRGESGKLLLLDEVISDALSGGHRILLFSQFTSMLKLIRERLNASHVSTFYLDGNTDVLERIKLVRSFNEGEGDVFLISLKAGGTGLNLTGADTVIHYDPWWNPAVEDQASDRAYRIGQDKVVHVMRLITKGTIEEKIEHLKEQKRNLTDAVIKPGETFVSRMSENEVMALFE
jgi:SNF2 family DNA or RNA helicase